MLNILRTFSFTVHRYTFIFRNSIDANRFNSVIIITVLGSARFIGAICLVHNVISHSNVAILNNATAYFISRSSIGLNHLIAHPFNLIPSRGVNRTMKKPPIIYLNEIVCFSAYPFTFFHSPIRFISFSCAFITVLV